MRRSNWGCPKEPTDAASVRRAFLANQGSLFESTAREARRYRKGAEDRPQEGASRLPPSLVLPIHDFIKTTIIGSMAAYLPEVLFLVGIPEGY